MDTLKPNTVGGISDPVNIAILDTDTYVKEKNLGAMTSVMIFEPSTHYFHPEGIFSEEIFGKIGSPDRLRRFGYIQLNTHILNPKIYRLIVQLGALYGEIMAGKTYAVFDPVEKNFIRVHGDPLQEKDADTGYSFFMKHFREIIFKTTDSSLRDERIEVIKQYQDVADYMTYLVCPAGIRDIRNDGGDRLVQDDINKLYLALLMYTRSIPKGSTSDVYDTVRYQIQSKCLEIYEYIENLVNGKHGFAQGSFSRRKVAYGTRNVISAATMIARTPDDPQMLKADEVMVGTYQTLKAFQPLTVFYMLTLFINPVFGTEKTQKIALTNLETHELEYVEIPEKERWRFTTSDGIESLVNRFGNHAIRDDPVTVMCTDGVARSPLLVYDDDDELCLCSTATDLKNFWPRKLVMSRLRPITWIEMFYIIATIAASQRHATATRYPVINGVGIVPTIPHIMSTIPARVVKFYNILEPDHPVAQFAEYPILGRPYFDIMAVHPSRLAGFGGD